MLNVKRILSIVTTVAFLSNPGFAAPDLESKATDSSTSAVGETGENSEETFYPAPEQSLEKVSIKVLKTAALLSAVVLAMGGIFWCGRWITNKFEEKKDTDEEIEKRLKDRREAARSRFNQQVSTLETVFNPLPIPVDPREKRKQQQASGPTPEPRILGQKEADEIKKAREKLRSELDQLQKEKVDLQEVVDKLTAQYVKTPEVIADQANLTLLLKGFNELDDTQKADLEKREQIVRTLESVLVPKQYISTETTRQSVRDSVKEKVLPIVEPVQ